MTYMDNVAMNRLPDLADKFGGNYSQDMMDWIQQSLRPPTIEEYKSDDWLAVGKAKREMMGQTCPGMPQTQQFFRDLADMVQKKSMEFSAALNF